MTEINETAKNDVRVLNLTHFLAKIKGDLASAIILHAVHQLLM